MSKKYLKLQGKYRRSRAANRELIKRIARDNIINTRRVVDKAIKNTKKAQAAMKKQLKSGGCCLCGFRYHQSLDFHHVDKKGGAMSQLSPTKMVKEIEECFIVVLCSNCHRLLHAGVIDPDFTGKRLTI
jgi:hypothetical protein